MFNEKQIKILQEELDSSRIKTREKAGIKLSYLEGFDVIEAANNIFGFGSWSYSIVSLGQVSQETNNNQNAVICYKAVVKVDVFSSDHSKCITRQDVGFGTGVAKSLADAHENGAKEAVTDALKRSLRTFGNQFGNSLYDKSRNYFPQNAQQNNLSKATVSLHKQEQKPNFYTRQNNLSQTDEQTTLQNLGLDIVQRNGFLLVTGKDVFSKKDTIKSLGFRWDNGSKQWYKAINPNVA
nr:Rad52/Rad22 family DNA repair protein [uncultured Campylobacter sp.]